MFDFRDPLARKPGGLGIGLNVGDKQKKNSVPHHISNPSSPIKWSWLIKRQCHYHRIYIAEIWDER